MFQNLSQGALVSVLYKNEPRVVDGKILSVNTHMPTFNPSQPTAMLNGLVTDLTLQIGNDTVPFIGLPANGVSANFSDRGIFIAIDKAAVVREVEAMVAASKQVLEQVPIHQKMVEECEGLLLKLQPERRKEAQREQDLDNLKTRLSEMNDKFDKLVEMLSAKGGGQS